MRNLFIGILISIFSIVFALLIFEVGYRLVSSKAKNIWNDRPKSYFIHEDSSTFQDLPYNSVKMPNTYRIAVIGDSFTFAPYMQFDDAFPKRLERYLNLNKNQSKVEVINYGVPAYSTSHEVAVVKKAIAESSDFIIVQITLNDPEIKPYTPTELYNERNRFGELELTHWIYKYWQSLGFIKKRLHNLQTHKNYTQKFFDLFQKPATWNNFKNSWEQIAKIQNQSNVPLVAVIFPLYGIALDQGYPFHEIHSKIKSLLDELNIPNHDLYKDFENIPLERMQVIVGQDFHPNEICHRLATESIMRWIEEKKFPPAQFLPKISYPQRTGIKLKHLEKPSN